MKKLNQAQIAQKLGISKSYLSMMLSGKRPIPDHLKSELCEQNQLQNCLPSRLSRVRTPSPAPSFSFLQTAFFDQVLACLLVSIERNRYTIE